MTDPGNPFTVPYAQVVADLERRIHEGTEQPDRYRFVYQSTVAAYELPREAESVTSASGIVSRLAVVFAADVDYVVSANRVTWTGNGRRPDNGSRVDVEFVYRERPSGLTDFNEGSVVGTLVRAVAREITTVYAQMDQAYRRAFIDVAEAVALDNVVALLGVVRNPAVAARGRVTYLLRTPTGKAVPILAHSRVADLGGRTFQTLVDAEILPQRDDVVSPDKGLLHTIDKIGKLLGVWPKAASPGAGNALPTKVVAPGQPFGADERTVALRNVADLAGEFLVRYAPKSVTVAVESTQLGPASDADAGTVTIMPTPPPGITGVVNEEAIGGGRPAESDDQLRVRAKHRLEQAGNATPGALRFGVLDVDGVEEVEVDDHVSDPSLPPGEVRLHYSAFGDTERIARQVDAVVEATRAAGVRVVAKATETVIVTGTFHVVPDPGADAAASAKRFVAAVVGQIAAQRIGEPLSPRRLAAFGYQVGGLADVAQTALWANGRLVPEPLVLDRTQRVRCDPAGIDVVALHAVQATRSKAGIDVRLVDAAGAPMIVVGTFTLDVAVEIAATLRTAPGQGPQRVGGFPAKITIADGTTGTLPVSEKDGPGPDYEQVAVVTVSAVPYPGLVPGVTTVDFG